MKQKRGCEENLNDPGPYKGPPVYPEKPLKKRIFKASSWSTVLPNTEEKVWTVGEVSILTGLTLFAGIGLWRIVEIICGLI